MNSIEEPEIIRLSEFLIKQNEMLMKVHKAFRQEALNTK